MNAVTPAAESAPKSRKMRGGGATATASAVGATDAPRTRPVPGAPQPIEVALYPDALLRISTVAAITGLSASSIFRKLAAGQFPQPIRLGTRCTRFKAGAVMAWLAAQQPAQGGA